MRFTRTYRSDNKTWTHNYQFSGIDLSNSSQASNWPSNSGITAYSLALKSTVTFTYLGSGQPNEFAIKRSNGRRLLFGSATDLSPASPNINDRVTRLTDGNGATTGWSVYNAANEETEQYDLTGRIVKITSRNSQVTTFTYSDATTPIAIAPKAGLLIKVADAFGHSLNFTYDSKSRLATMTDPGNGVYTYAYDEASSIVVSGNQPAGNLTSVTYPDNKKRIYWYNEQDKTSNTNLPFALTGITDEIGIRYATIKYDNTGMGISTELANGAQKYTVAYPMSTANYNIQSTVTDPLNATRTYNFAVVQGVVQNTSVKQPAGSGSSAASTTTTYDVNGNVASITDFNGSKTTYAYDLARNLETSRTEASGSGFARTITTQWHPTYRLPVAISEPLRKTTFNYDNAGNLLLKSVQATSDANGSQGLSAPTVGTARNWSYTYNQVGQVLTAIGPRTDVTDVTTYAYDDATGNLVTITNAAGQVTTLSNYDANGRVGTITDPNGLTTTLTYTPRGWLQSKVVSGANGGSQTTGYHYDGAGQLTSVDLPGNSTVTYTYDDAHRLTDIADSFNNRIHYTLDAMGNRVNEQVTDPNGTLARQTTRIFDALNRLQQVTGATQ